VAAAASYAPHRGRVKVIAADREPAVSSAGFLSVGHVEADPARLIGDPHVGPGVARDFPGLAAVEVATHVARRDAGRAAAGDEHVRLVLAHADTEFEGLGRAVRDVGDPRLIGDGAPDGFDEVGEAGP
jgi:hypothetical protein